MFNMVSLSPFNTNNHCVGTRNNCVSYFNLSTVLKYNYQAPMFIRAPPPSTQTTTV